MNQKNVVVLTNGNIYEVWGSLKQLCTIHKFSYNYLKRKRFPFRYKELDFIKVPYRFNMGLS